MIDREKVIKGLELCDIGSDKMCYECDCPYYQNGCTERLKEDALELLKEQEPVESIRQWDDDETTWWYSCGSCVQAVDYKDKYCRHCGRRLRWDAAD